MRKIIWASLATIALWAQATIADDHQQKVCVANIQSKNQTVQEVLDSVGCKRGDKVVISTFLGKFGVPVLYAVPVTSARICDFTQSVTSNNVAQNTVTTCVYTGKVLPIIGSDKAMKAFSGK